MGKTKFCSDCRRIAQVDSKEMNNGHSSHEPFLTLYPFMWKTLGLKGTQLLVFGRIYGFCKGGGSFYESRSGTAKYLNISERSVVRSIKELHEAGVIEETTPSWHPDGFATRSYVVAKNILGMEANATTDKFSSPVPPVHTSTTNEDSLSSTRVTGWHLIKKEDNKDF